MNTRHALIAPESAVSASFDTGRSQASRAMARTPRERQEAGRSGGDESGSERRRPRPTGASFHLLDLQAGFAQPHRAGTPGLTLAPPMTRSLSLGAAVVLALISTAPHALAQSRTPSSSEAAGAAAMEAGYGDAGTVATRTFNPVTRDADGNRLIVNGAIVDARGGSSLSYSTTSSNTLSGAAYFESGAAGLTNSATATAIGNLISISVVGRGNVILLNARQTNSGDIRATVPQP